MKKLAQDGKCWDAAEKEFKLAGYESWPGYANNLQFVARRYVRCGDAAPDRHCSANKDVLSGPLLFAAADWDEFSPTRARVMRPVT